MLRSMIIFVLLSASNWATALPWDAKSAHREPTISYKAYSARARMFAFTQQQNMRTPLDEAKAFETAQLPQATEWESEEVMLERFKQLRDHRFLTRDSRPEFLRRSSWLFPDDGCFARAQLANRNLSQWLAPVPSKVFVFGDLNVKTNNAPGGSVTWWYHVAPLVQVNGQKYVLDPAIEPSRPLKLQEWLERQSPTAGRLEVAVCASGAYTPYESCSRENNGVEKEAEMDQGWFLDAEWERLESLGRKPESELGDTPPWLN